MHLTTTYLEDAVYRVVAMVENREIFKYTELSTLIQVIRFQIILADHII